jgi:hypothetical protein
MTKNILDSSANNKIADKLIFAHKSVKKILNSRGHEVESCGTPGSLGIGEEKSQKFE